MKPLISNIVVAISGSDASINAAKYAITLARQYGCSLTAVYVVDTATLRRLVITNIFIEDESADYEKSLEENGERYLKYVRDLASQKSLKIETLLRKGAIYTEILRLADEKSADLIILGGWERQRQGRDIISEAHKEILVNAKCSVLVAKEEGIEKIFSRL
ncbi:MAG: universal stress protein [Spirochaetales bacterium]|jgi:nucleotide-binding universal stress UspA family protein|nr:universal stress protein [Spirochaetales bacterium]